MKKKLMIVTIFMMMPVAMLSFSDQNDDDYSDDDDKSSIQSKKSSWGWKKYGVAAGALGATVLAGLYFNKDNIKERIAGLQNKRNDINNKMNDSVKVNKNDGVKNLISSFTSKILPGYSNSGDSKYNISAVLKKKQAEMLQKKQHDEDIRPYKYSFFDRVKARFGVVPKGRTREEMERLYQARKDKDIKDKDRLRDAHKNAQNYTYSKGKDKVKGMRDQVFKDQKMRDEQGKERRKQEKIAKKQKEQDEQKKEATRLAELKAKEDKRLADLKAFELEENENRKKRGLTFFDRIKNALLGNEEKLLDEAVAKHRERYNLNNPKQNSAIPNNQKTESALWTRIKNALTSSSIFE
jgi:hypothetical protein